MKQVVVWMVVLGFVVSVVGAQETEPDPGVQVAEQALFQAAFQGQLRDVEYLVSRGISADAVDAEKRTALMWASFNGHLPIIRYLLEQGATVDHKDSAGRTALMYAASGPYPETVELLLKKGADPNVQGTLEGFTPLMTAAAEGHVDVVHLLLRHGADAGVKDKDGDTAESFAKEKGHTAVVELLQNPPSAVEK